ncbi:predicted protein [Nematostella vectensis]|uniref:UspA domain-containing protein n=1 Tax=Nematostella vectensis TaxID=45351 RepID=A7SDN9_NEMVE|nr:universal stress protein A-like protein [Nematostella vectensis]EDO38142.1 predicted protein [Nematostella vectensis]|eukprot:XP_001630205.1 predicted protein [Nematostella vectensis]
MASDSSSCKRKVVLALDGSVNSMRAYQWYWDNIYQEGDLLLVIHAFELPTMPAAPYPYGFAYYEEWSSLVQKADDEAKHLLEDCGRKCQEKICSIDPEKKKNIHFKLFKETGKPGEVVCKFAQDENAHLIIMGSRGLGTLRRTFLGSNSDYCVHHAHIPVAVVPPPPEHEESQSHKD